MHNERKINSKVLPKTSNTFRYIPLFFFLTMNLKYITMGIMYLFKKTYLVDERVFIFKILMIMFLILNRYNNPFFVYFLGRRFFIFQFMFFLNRYNPKFKIWEEYLWNVMTIRKKGLIVS